MRMRRHAADRSPSNCTASGALRSSPAIDFNSVDLPAPLAPITATVSPRAEFELDAEQRLEVAIEGVERMDAQQQRSFAATPI